MARVVKELGVPASIIGKMVVTPPDEMVWLTPTDLRSMGTVMTGNFAQGSTNQASLSPRSQEQVKTQSELLSSDPAPTWEKLLDRALALSTAQNGGNPEFDRLCQPEFKQCINVLGLKTPDGTDMLIRVTEDIDGTTQKREICSFNREGHIRSCFDWDTGKQIRDIKKGKDWHRVND
jgi:hypothetical protein